MLCLKNLQMVVHWGNGFWKLLSFSMQMALVLVTGHALASAPVIKKGLSKLASFVKTPGQAILAVSLISGIACWINWGIWISYRSTICKRISKTSKRR